MLLFLLICFTQVTPGVTSDVKPRQHLHASDVVVSTSTLTVTFPNLREYIAE